MDEVVDVLLSRGTMVLMGVAYIGTFFVRRILETAIPALQQKGTENSPKVTYPNALSKWWNKVILYAIPCLVAALVGLADIPFIYEDITTLAGRMVYGVFAGFLSGGMFKVIKQMISARTGAKLSGSPAVPE